MFCTFYVTVGRSPFGRVRLFLLIVSVLVSAQNNVSLNILFVLLNDVFFFLLFVNKFFDQSSTSGVICGSKIRLVVEVIFCSESLFVCNHLSLHTVHKLIITNIRVHGYNTMSCVQSRPLV